MANPVSAMKEIFTLRLDEDTRSRLDKLQEAHGGDQSAAVRWALEILQGIKRAPIDRLAALARFRGLKPGALLSQVVERGLRMEEQGITTTGEAAPETYGKPKPAPVEARLAKVEGDVEGLRSGQEQILAELKGWGKVLKDAERGGAALVEGQRDRKRTK
jgi:predicted transcriptional regulator